MPADGAGGRRRAQQPERSILERNCWFFESISDSRRPRRAGLDRDDSSSLIGLTAFNADQIEAAALVASAAIARLVAAADDLQRLLVSSAARTTCSTSSASRTLRVSTRVPNQTAEDLKRQLGRHGHARGRVRRSDAGSETLFRD